MKIGYACINESLECRSSRTFRLKNYSHERFKETVEGNLHCLLKILKYNKEHGISFFRITSDLIPFASHSIMDFDWQKHFEEKFKEIGHFIKNENMRISMHPGQYTVLNSNSERVFQNSLKELEYHVDVLDLMELPQSAKVLTHVGGVYGNKERSIERFITRYNNLDERLKQRYVIENDDKSYTLKDCLKIHKETGIPIIFDIYHHECKNKGGSIIDGIKKAKKTWKKTDGNPIIHYSSLKEGGNWGNHALHLDENHFKGFLKMIKNIDIDIMLEIKDKEQSALKALDIFRKIRESD